ncbi:MAG: hypothetical protein M1821_008925 [Bathelium mastoideum]|nr:MAG: hypothetical protein M1821_008925 [Bathelium mastoideum]
MARFPQPRGRNDFEIAIICALQIEADAVEAMFDEFWEGHTSYGKAVGDSNTYTTGRIGEHNVVLAHMPGMGKSAAAAVATNIPTSFERIRLGLVVGICGGVPKSAEDGEEIILGDVVVSTNVVQFDLARQYPHRTISKNTLEDNLGRQNPEIRGFLQKMKGARGRKQLKDISLEHLTLFCGKDEFHSWRYPGADEDILFPSTYRHQHHTLGACSICADEEGGFCQVSLESTCGELECDTSNQVPRERLRNVSYQAPKIHFGRFASGDLVMKSGSHRDQIAKQEKVVAFEMEGAGVWDNLPTVILRGVCEYADSHKNKKWQKYAAASAAACMKAILKDWRGLDRPGAPQALPRALSTVPFRRDPDFVDRGDTLAQIDQRCCQSAGRVALVGLGGVGKSQFAIEYAYRVRARSPYTWIFWVHAGTQARFVEGYRRIAESIKIPGLDDPKADVLRLVRNWLCDESNGQWLMIVDNADDSGVFFPQADTPYTSSSSTEAFSDLLPQSPNGSILITSRNRDAAFRLTGYSADIIEVGPMDQIHALALARKKLHKAFEPADAAALLEALDYMPLAITQAAVYISQGAPRITISSYLATLRNSDGGRAKLLSTDLGDIRRDGTASNSVMTTWKISFEYIRKVKPSATQLLSLMSLFDRQGIPESLLRSNYQELDGTGSDFEDDLAILSSFSLVTMDVGGSQLEMHRLVQFSTKRWLELNDELGKWKEKYVRLLDKKYPPGEYENWTTCRALFPHVQALAGYHLDDAALLAAWASTLVKAAQYASQMGNYQVAGKMVASALEARKATLGVEHPDTLRSLHGLGIVLNQQGKYQEAEAVHRQGLETSRRLLGEEHPHTLDNLHGLGVALERQGKYQEAEAVHRQGLETSRMVLGEKHPHTPDSLHGLGVALKRQGKYQETETVHRQGLETSRRLLGEEHLSPLYRLNSLGSVLKRQGEYQEAEAAHRQGLETSRRVLGAEHPITLANMTNLALTLRKQNQLTEAEQLQLQVIEIRKKVLGAEHPTTLNTMASLAVTFGCQNRLMEAEQLQVQAMETCKRTLGADHPNRLMDMHNLAVILKSKGEGDKAIMLMEECTERQKRVFGPDHSRTKLSQDTLNIWRMDDLHQGPSMKK